MDKNLSAVLLSVVFFVVPGCGGGRGSAIPVCLNPSNIAGNWVEDANDNSGSGKLYMTLSQDGCVITGQIWGSVVNNDGSWSPDCSDSANLNGFISGNDFEITTSSPGSECRVVSRGSKVGPKELTGTFQREQCPIGGGGGSFDAKPMSAPPC